MRMGNCPVSTQEYFKRSFWSPIIAPLLALLHLYLTRGGVTLDEICEPMSARVDSEQYLALFIVSTLFWGGIPYLVTLLVHHKKFSGWAEGEYNVFTFRLPWLMLVPLAVTVPITCYVMDGQRGPDYYSAEWSIPISAVWPFVYLFTLFVTMVVGYSYVLWTHILLAILRAIGIVLPGINAGTESTR